MRAHWRLLANTTELVLPSAHPIPQPKRQIDRFSRFCTVHVRVSSRACRGMPFPWGDLDPMVPWRTRVLNPNGISIGSAVFAGFTSVTDRPTDRPRYSVGNNRPHLYVSSTAMWPNTKLSYRRGTARRRVVCHLKSSQLLQSTKNRIFQGLQ